MPAAFTPPTIDDVPRYLPESTPVQKRLMRHYAPLARGRSVLLVNGHYTTVDVPDTTGLTEGVHFFLGGHHYIVSDAMAAALFADGYTVGELVLGSEGGLTLITEGGDTLVPEGI